MYGVRPDASRRGRRTRGEADVSRWFDSWPERFFVALGCVAAVAIVVAILFSVPRRAPGKGREALERLREGTVEIIADGVEKGVRRASGEAETEGR